MLQQSIAVIIILFFIIRLIIQKKQKKISAYEFFFWLLFWITGLAAIALIKYLDKFVDRLGFSSSGIDVLFYLSVAVIFYFIFRLRIRLEKIERDITKIVREIALNNKNKKYDS